MSNDVSLSMRRSVNSARLALRKDATFTSLPLRNIHRICRFAADAVDDAGDDHEDRLLLDRSVGATLSMLGELFVVEVCHFLTPSQSNVDVAAVQGVLDQLTHCDFLKDIRPRQIDSDDDDSSDDNDDDDELDLGAYRLIDDASRDVGRLWLQLYCSPSDRGILLCKGRIDLLLCHLVTNSSSSSSSSPPRLLAEFQDCSAVPRRMIFECASAMIVSGNSGAQADAASLVRGLFEFNDASRIDLSGETQVTRLWRAINEPAAVDSSIVDTLSDRGTALLKFSFAHAAVDDGVSGMVRTDTIFDCFPEKSK